jgi:hypothetical protein
MPWVEENSATGTWVKPTIGAFQRNAFQTNAFQVDESHGWQESSGEDSTWSEEAAA